MTRLLPHKKLRRSVAIAAALGATSLVCAV
jgi:hypothetical protein